jgi:hypothetical protein
MHDHDTTQKPRYTFDRSLQVNESLVSIDNDVDVDVDNDVDVDVDVEGRGGSNK